MVISGPSGSGKTTICRYLTQSPDVALSVSATTRKIRNAEEDGVDYYFLEEAEFLNRVRRGEFLEYAQYNDNYYGTLKSEIQAKQDAGYLVILEIEVQGTRYLRETGVDANFIFIMPPSLTELERRLRARETEDDETIERRLKIARDEMDMSHLYDHVVINEALEKAVEDVRTFLGLHDPKS